MNKFLIRFICCFIPNRDLRHFLRKCRFGFYKIKGKNNQILFYERKLPRFLKIVGLGISINGNNNTIEIKGCKKAFKNTRFIISANNNIYELGHINFMHNVTIFSSWCNNQKFYFGDNSDCNGARIYLFEEEATVSIGKNTIMSTNIDIWPTDGHSVIDKNTGSLLNALTKPILIGDNCWIAQGVRILKNVSIPSNTIIGAGSVVTKSFKEEFTIIAGNPAQVIKTNVSWDPMNPYYKKCEQGIKK